MKFGNLAIDYAVKYALKTCALNETLLHEEQKLYA